MSVLLLSSPALSRTLDTGNEIPLNIKAQDLKFEQDTGLISASGSVEAKFEDVTIASDRMSVDTNTDMATAEGNVLLKRKDYGASASRVVYDIKKDTALVRDFKASISPKEIKGKIFLNIGELRDDKDVQTGSLGRVTSCDLDHPHYFLMAKSFYFKPNDKLVGNNVTLYVGDVPVMWVPCYIYDLSRRRVTMLMPIIGSNPVEGNFLKSEFQYFVDNGSTGSVYVDLMERKGVGYGIDNYYKLGEKQSGNVYLYHVSEYDTGISDWVAKIRDELRINNSTKLTLSEDYSSIYMVPTGRLDQSETKVNYDFANGGKSFSAGFDLFNNNVSALRNYSLSLSRADGSTRTDYFYGFNGSSSAPEWENVTQRFSHSQNIISNNLNVSLNANYYRSITEEGAPADVRIEPSVDLTYLGSFYTMKLSESQYFTPNIDKYAANNNAEYVEKLPELTMSFNPVSIASVNIKTQADYGTYHESKYIAATNSQRHFTASRYGMESTASDMFKIPAGSTLSLSAGLEQYYYGTGDERYTQSEDLTLSTDLGGFFLNTFNADRSLSEGNSPFFFDTKQYYSNMLRDTMVLYKGTAHRLTLDGGYNYTTNQYADLLMRYEGRPDASLNYSFSSGYDIQDKIWRDLVSAVTLVPFAGAQEIFSHTYDMNVGMTKSASNLLEFGIGDSWQNTWHFRISHGFDYTRNVLVLQEAEIIKDLHCWEVKYSWSDFLKEFKLTFTLKAFPDTPIGYASGNNGFFLEGENKESPQRY